MVLLIALCLRRLLYVAETHWMWQNRCYRLNISSVWIFMWTFRCIHWLNASPHVTFDAHAILPVYVMFMLLQVAGRLKLLSHTCTASLDGGLSCESSNLHSEYALCHRHNICMVSVHCVSVFSAVHNTLGDCVNRLPQTVYLNCFSPEWICPCTARRLLLSQHLPHSVHLYLPLWIFIMVVQTALSWKTFLTLSAVLLVFLSV